MGFDIHHFDQGHMVRVVVSTEYCISWIFCHHPQLSLSEDPNPTNLDYKPMHPGTIINDEQNLVFHENLYSIVIQFCPVLSRWATFFIQQLIVKLHTSLMYGKFREAATGWYHVQTQPHRTDSTVQYTSVASKYATHDT